MDKVSFEPEKFGAFMFFGWLSGFSLALCFTYSWLFILLFFLFFAMQLMTYNQRNAVFREIKRDL